MKKRIVELTILVSFLTVFIDSNMYSQSELEVVKNEQETVKTIVPEKYKIAHSKRDSQEDIRNEIMYGDMELLAQLIEAEAGNQDELGKRYVADVVLNRVESSLFPDSIFDVIYQDTQFSVVDDGALNEAGWCISDESFRIAKEEYDGPRKNYNILYFTSGRYNDSGTPSFKYGAHYFSTR